MVEVFIWRFSFRHGNVGHAALGTGRTYVSWWPDREAGLLGVYRASPHDALAEDIDAEGHTPDRRIKLPGLREAAIDSWWQEFSTGHRTWRVWRQNCASVVAQAIRSGGAPNVGSHMIWLPTHIEDLADRLR